MLKYASLTLARDYNIEKGEGVEKWKFEIEKLTRLTKQVFFEECLNCFCPWLWVRLDLTASIIPEVSILNT